jgi:hypothetical protein
MKPSKSAQALQEYVHNLHALERTIKEVKVTADALHNEIASTEATVQKRKTDIRAARMSGGNGLPAKEKKLRRKSKEEQGSGLQFYRC